MASETALVVFRRAQTHETPTVEQVFRDSFMAQISDCRLRALIPLSHPAPLSFDAIVPRVSLLSRISLQEDSEDVFAYFEKSQDLMHLQSILSILEGGEARLKDPSALKVLSHYFEALSVYGGSLTTRHWVMEEDGLTLTIWSMLSYYSHLLKVRSHEHGHILGVIQDKLIKALQKDTPIFRAIYRYELLREQRTYLRFKHIELQVKEFTKLSLEQRAPEKLKKNGCLAFFSGLCRIPECEELTSIAKRKALSPEEKVQYGKEIWEALAFTSPDIRAGVMGSKKITESAQRIRELDEEMKTIQKTIETKEKKAALNPVKRALQGFYEYEQLQVALAYTEEVLQKKECNQLALTQWLIVLRESLKMMLTDQTLNIAQRKSLSSYSQLIKTIRDYFEHPEDYVLRLDHIDRRRQEEQRRQLEKALFQDLQRMGKRIRGLMQERLKKIEQILQIHPHIDPRAVVQALAIRDKEPHPRLSDMRQAVTKEYPGAGEFIERIVEKRESQTLVKEKLFIPSPHARSRLDIFNHLNSACERLRILIHNLSRMDLEKKLLEDGAFRLMMQRQVSLLTRLVKDWIKSIQKEGVENYTLFEEGYLALRDARNFQTHDLWRQDIQGLINAIYLLSYDYPAALSGYTPCGDLENTIIQEASYCCTLTKEQLEMAIEDGLKLNARDTKGRTLLHFLALHPSPEFLQMAQILMRHGGNIHYADYVGMRPLHYAAEAGFIDLAHLFIQQGAPPDISSRLGTPTEIAQSHGHTELAKVLSEYRGMRRSSNAKGVLDAVESLDVARVRHLVEEKNYDPFADFEGSLPLVALFRKKYVDEEVRLEIAGILMIAGADVNQQEPESKQSALHAAAETVYEKKLIQTLMEYCSHINARDCSEKTPLHAAVDAQNAEWVKEFLKAGALVNTRDDLGRTPLLDACDTSRPSIIIIKELLRHGADVEGQTEYGNILHHAAYRGSHEVVHLLLRYGASPFSIDHRGLMPYQLSRSQSMIALFMERMRFVFSHLSTEDQNRLIERTGRIQSPFWHWREDRSIIRFHQWLGLRNSKVS